MNTQPTFVKQEEQPWDFSVGKPYYELLAEMNGLPPDFDTGVDLAYSTQPHITPNLTEDPMWIWRDEAPESCPGQGIFYDVERLLDQ